MPFLRVFGVQNNSPGYPSRMVIRRHRIGVAAGVRVEVRNHQKTGKLPPYSLPLARAGFFGPATKRQRKTQSVHLLLRTGGFQL